MTVNDVWGACVGQVLPEAQEQCGNGIDDDCNGLIDDNCQPRDCIPVAEICGDNIDNDCDGVVDDGCPVMAAPPLTRSATATTTTATGSSTRA